MKRTKPTYQNNKTPIKDKDQKRQNKYISEKNFMSNVVSKAKGFIKDKYKSIKKSAKKIFRDIKKEFMQPKSKMKFKAGSLIAMNYNAKDATRRFDRSPLIICLGWSQNPKLRYSHFYGLNLHWMPMKDRVYIASFFTALNEKKGGIQYGDIKPFLHKFKGSPVLRMYIYKNISGKVIAMPREHFLTAASIPGEVWAGGK